jgi:hypothetical protein
MRGQGVIRLPIFLGMLWTDSAGGTCPALCRCEEMAGQPSALFLTCSIQTSFSGKP